MREDTGPPRRHGQSRPAGGEAAHDLAGHRAVGRHVVDPVQSLAGGERHGGRDVVGMDKLARWVGLVRAQRPVAGERPGEPRIHARPQDRRRSQDGDARRRMLKRPFGDQALGLAPLRDIFDARIGP